MERWFGKTTYQPFEVYSLSHILVLTVFFIGLFYLILNYKKLQRHSTLYECTRWSLFGILLISEITYQIWAITNNVWSFAEYVPLHLCGIASLLAMVALWSLRPSLIKINYFIGIIPAFLALITPELVNDFPHYRFWKFFSHHMAITLASLFLIMTYPVQITFRSLLKAFGILNLYAVFVFFLNREIGSNYLYLSRTPTASTPLDLLGDSVWYYIHLEILTFVVFTIMWAFYKAIPDLWRKKK